MEDQYTNHEEPYNIRVTVSAYAGRKLRVYRSVYGIKNAEAIDKILTELVVPGFDPRKAQKEK